MQQPENSSSKLLICLFMLQPIPYLTLFQWKHKNSQLVAQCGNFLPSDFRWNLFRKLQSHREMPGLHTMHRSIPHGHALHRLQRRHLRVQLWLLLQWPLSEVWAVHQMSGGSRHVPQLWARPRHDLWGVRRRHLFGPGKFSGTMHTLHHLWWRAGEKGLHVCQWYGLSRSDNHFTHCSLSSLQPWMYFFMHFLIGNKEKDAVWCPFTRCGVCKLLRPGVYDPCPACFPNIPAYELLIMRIRCVAERRHLRWGWSGERNNQLVSANCKLWHREFCFWKKAF